MADTDGRLGAIYSFDKNTYMDVIYKHHKYDSIGIVNFTAKGLGFGLDFKFFPFTTCVQINIRRRLIGSEQTKGDRDSSRKAVVWIGYTQMDSFLRG